MFRENTLKTTYNADKFIRKFLYFKIYFITRGQLVRKARHANKYGHAFKGNY